MQLKNSSFNWKWYENEWFFRLIKLKIEVNFDSNNFLNWFLETNGRVCWLRKRLVLFPWKSYLFILVFSGHETANVLEFISFILYFIFIWFLYLHNECNAKQMIRSIHSNPFIVNGSVQPEKFTISGIRYIPTQSTVNIRYLV